MRFEFKLAWRYLTARKRSLTRFTAAVAVVGIAAGVASLIFAETLARGFADEMRDKILANSAHVRVTLTGGGPIADAESVRAKIAAIGNVRSVEPGAMEHAVVSSENATSYALLKADDEYGVRVGRSLADALRIVPGEKIEVVTLGSRQPKRITVDGILDTGIHDYDATWIALPKQKFAGVAGEESFSPRSLEVRVADIYRSPETARRIGEVLGADFKAIDWQSQNRELFAALSLERRIMTIIIRLIIFIATINITVTLSLLVIERRYDFGVLRACGARSRSIISIVLIEGLILGLTGIAVGILSGILVCVAAEKWQLVKLSEEVYSLSRVPLQIRPESVLLIALTALITVVAASLYPAVRANRMLPVENLRSH